MKKISIISTETINYFSLLIELIRRQFSKSHQGTVAGLFWPLLEPLAMLIIYTIFFGVILQGRWGFSGNPTEYGFVFFSGLIVFNFFAECFRQFPHLIGANPNYVKKIVFPLELLPAVVIVTALIHALIATGIWCVAYAILVGFPNWTALISPLILFSMVPMLLALGWIFSVIGLLAKDVNQVTVLFTQMLLFLTPIFYGIDVVPEALRFWIRLNPLTYLVEQFRLMLIYGVMPGLTGLGIFILINSLLAAGAFLLFRRVRRNQLRASRVTSSFKVWVQLLLLHQTIW